MLLPIHTAVFIPADYGVISALYSYVSLFIVLFTYGMETGFFRFATNHHDKQRIYSTAQISLLFSSTIFFILISFFASSIARFIGFAEHPEYILCFAAVLALDAISAVPFARLRIENRPVKYGIIKLINVLVNVGLTAWFLIIQPFINSGEWLIQLNADSIIYVLISNLIASAVTLVLAVGTVRNLRIKTKSNSIDEPAGQEPSNKFKFDFAIWKKMFRYSLPLLIVGLAGMVNETLDRVLLLHLLPYGDKQNFSLVGIYSACYKLSILMTLFVGAYRMAAEPFFFNEANKADAKKIYAQTMNYFVIACSFLFIFVMCFLEYFKYFLGNESYYTGLQIVPVLLLANLFLGVYYNLTIWYKLTDKTIYGSYISLFGAGITIGLNFYLIPKIGFMGSAWTTLACYSMMMIVSYFLGQKIYFVPYSIKRFLLYVGLALFLGWFCNPFYHQLFESHQALYLLASAITLALFVCVVFFAEKFWKQIERQ